jgi:hypothetical protein
LEKAFTIGLVTSLEKPHNAKHVVIIINGSTRFVPFFIKNPDFFIF